MYIYIYKRSGSGGKEGLIEMKTRKTSPRVSLHQTHAHCSSLLKFNRKAEQIDLRVKLYKKKLLRAQSR